MKKLINGLNAFLDSTIYTLGEVIYYSAYDAEYYTLDTNGNFFIKG